MNTNQNHHLHKIAEQTTNNSTGWVGELPGNRDHVIKGQTFIASEEGDIKAIKVFSNVIARNSNVTATLHQYDPQNQSWGQVLGSASVDLQRSDVGKWITFDIHGPHLTKGQSYGFRLDSVDSYIGLGEACGSAKQPAFNSGKEWQFTRNNPQGDSFAYFSLVFEIDIAA